MGAFILLLLCGLVLTNQYRYSRKVMILEKYSRVYIVAMRLIAVLFIAWGVFYLQDAAFILVTILIALIIWVHPYSTGLSKTEIIYQQKIGFGGFSPKTQNLSEIINYRFINKKDKMKVIFNVQDKFQIDMQFSQADKDKIETLIHNHYK